MRCKDKVAIVTGSGRGIGKGIAEELAKEGAIVAVAELNEADGLETEREIRELGGRAQYIHTDVRSEDSIRTMVDAVEERYGRIDVLVNNAGITVFKSIFEATAEDWDQVIGIDLRSVFLCSKYAGLVMKQQQKGSIINISSNHSIATLPNAEMYAAAKAGVNGMTRSMALSLRKLGIRVNAICPGFTDSPHYRSWRQRNGVAEEVEKELFFLHSDGRMNTPEDIGRLAVFLASEESEMITGAEMIIDGGMSARLYNSRIC